MMKLFKCICWSISRRYCGYITVSRPTTYKTVVRDKGNVSSLAKALHLKISAGGPISVAEYMRACLTNPSVGYYMQKDNIGREGDFVTSPEISQVFGELIGVWIMNTFNKIGGSRPWQLIELGPGKGTLMADILRTFEVLKFTENLSVHLVEVSPQMAAIQSHTLGIDVVQLGVMPRRDPGETSYKSAKTPSNIPVHWYENLNQVPNAFSVVLAHEFFDVLPIHKFERHDNKWHELLIESYGQNGEYNFQYVLSENESPLAKFLIQENELRDHVEVSPEAGAIAGQVAKRIDEFGGFSLFIDYGHEGDGTDTFRAFQKHQLVDPLVNPGTADLTADVDFSFLKRNMNTFTVGPVLQKKFLGQLKIRSRLNMLVEGLKPAEAETIISNVRILTNKKGMGTRYKCLAAFPSVLEKYLTANPVPGFSAF